jgi:hypothetical protein
MWILFVGLGAILIAKGIQGAIQEAKMLPDHRDMTMQLSNTDIPLINSIDISEGVESYVDENEYIKN